MLPTLSWWHTSIHADWPSADYDPVALLDDPTRRRLGEWGLDERWAQRQKTKALHVGTYEAAIHNTCRRSSRQGDRGRQFYLYRVCLRPDVVVAPGYGEELVDFVGDVQLAEACPSGIDATRYVNRHEDPGGISLALGRGAIYSVQSLPIPLAPDPGRDDQPGWFATAVAALTAASTEPVLVVKPDNELTRLFRRRNPMPPTTSTTSRRREAQREIRDRILEGLPAALRDDISALIPIDDTITPERWCEHLAAATQLVMDPLRVIQAVAATAPRRV